MWTCGCAVVVGQRRRAEDSGEGWLMGCPAKAGRSALIGGRLVYGGGWGTEGGFVVEMWWLVEQGVASSKQNG